MTTTPTAPSTTVPTAAGFPPDAYAAYAAAENARRSSSTRTAVMTAVGVLVGAGIAAGLFFGLGGGSEQPVAPTTAPTTAPVAAPTSHVTVGHRTVVVPSGQVTPAPKPAPTPAAQPSAAVETLQRELGQLNYYEGPITGTMNTQTVAAIKDLQRDAGLPQTGTMNAATQQALVKMLAQGNNQMNS